MTINKIREKLNSKKSAERRNAAKTIGKGKIFELSEELYQKYLYERKDKRTRETQCEMIKTIGILEYRDAIKAVEEIVNENIPHDMITYVAATTYVQLKRKSINDGKPVLELLKFGSLSVIEGALLALVIDKMIPKKTTINEILVVCRDINKHKDHIGEEDISMDPRLYLAIACSMWDIKLTRNFLNHSIETAYYINRFGKTIKDQDFINICQNSLKGKFSKGYC